MSFFTLTLREWLVRETPSDVKCADIKCEVIEILPEFLGHKEMQSISCAKNCKAIFTHQKSEGFLRAFMASLAFMAFSVRMVTNLFCNFENL